MNEQRRGMVILLQGGDPEISGALAEGVMRGRGCPIDLAPLGHFPPAVGKHGEARPLESDQIEVVQAEIDRQHIVASLVRVAVGNDKTAEDYGHLVTKARGDYGRYSRPPGPARRVLRRLLGVYGLAVYVVSGLARGWR